MSETEGGRRAARTEPEALLAQVAVARNGGKQGWWEGARGFCKPVFLLWRGDAGKENCRVYKSPATMARELGVSSSWTVKTGF